MIEGWALWLVLVGFGVGVAVTAVALWRLPRREDDVGPDERPVEAEWIAGTIERNGGVAPTSLVEEVLDLHAAYRQALRVPGPPPGTGAPPVTVMPPATAAPALGQPGQAPGSPGAGPPTPPPSSAPSTPPPSSAPPPPPGYAPPPPGHAPPAGPGGPPPPGRRPPS